MLVNELKIGFFLAWRQIKRASLWTTILIIFIMVLTFINLVVVSGILVGLIEGAVRANKDYYTSDILISKLQEKDYIENTPFITDILDNMKEIQVYSPRYLEGGKIEAGYKEKTDNTKNTNAASANFAGINPGREIELTNINKFIIEGSFLQPDDFDQVVLGAYLLEQYFPVESPGFTTLKNVGIGSKVRIKVGSTTREVTVKGILKTKVDEISMRLFMPEKQLRLLIGRTDYNVDEISVKLKEGADATAFKEKLLHYGLGNYARVQTFEDAQPKFLKDIKDTFALLGIVISSIGLVVAIITVFIVIFINAITRRKFIGILKGIGISKRAIEFSYVMQSLFYALCGAVIGVLVVYGMLIPFFDAHPINFPFSDGILVATPFGTGIRLLVMTIVTMIAGYVPARIIVRRNTLDAILGR
jgi:putative ABC transport system permease protein